MSAKFTAATRALHWLGAALVFSTLIVGFLLASRFGSYLTMLTIHKALGATVFVVFAARVVNRLTHRAPVMPATVGPLERRVVALTELGMYALVLAQPLLGWAVLSAAGSPVVLFDGLRLPPIAPVDPAAFAGLRNAHSVVAYTLVVMIAAHVSAVLMHTVTLRDGMLRRMT